MFPVILALNSFKTLCTATGREKYEIGLQTRMWNFASRPQQFISTSCQRIYAFNMFHGSRAYYWRGNNASHAGEKARVGLRRNLAEVEKKKKGMGNEKGEKGIGEKFKWLVCRLSRLAVERANIKERSVCADSANCRLKWNFSQIGHDFKWYYCHNLAKPQLVSFSPKLPLTSSRSSLKRVAGSV